jgi:DNA polymerase III delta prime subunit
MNNKNEVWVEKYRPKMFQNVVLDKVNKRIFQNIIQSNYFPNLLLHGPPGCGKTTTAINLINEYQRKTHEICSSNIIHLNSSDERGIDVIRNQILQFAQSFNFFVKGLKFVILDEVDYMTKNAQQALKYILQSCPNNIRFCLICNYITKIDTSLKHEFVCIRFHQLPPKSIHAFLKEVSLKEGLTLHDETFVSIQQLYHNDIRSMINFMQLNQNLPPSQWQNTLLTTEFLTTTKNLFQREDIGICDIQREIYNYSIRFNIDLKSFLLKYVDFLFRQHPQYRTEVIINEIERIIHNTNDIPSHILLNYFAIFHKKHILG